MTSRRKCRRKRGSRCVTWAETLPPRPDLTPTVRAGSASVTVVNWQKRRLPSSPTPTDHQTFLLSPLFHRFLGESVLRVSTSLTLSPLPGRVGAPCLYFTLSPLAFFAFISSARADVLSSTWFYTMYARVRRYWCVKGVACLVFYSRYCVHVIIDLSLLFLLLTCHDSRSVGSSSFCRFF